MLDHSAIDYLSTRGIDKNKALELGFFSCSKSEGKKLINQYISGMAITYFDIENKVIGYRVRPFKEDWQKSEKLREYYLEKSGELPKFLSRSKADTSNDLNEQRINKAYFSPAINWQEVQRKSSIDVLITEGEVKATLACLKGIPTIALAGVNGIYNKIKIGKDTVREFLPELEWECKEEFRDTYWKGRNVGLCFDSDIISKWQVKNALLNLSQELTLRGAKVFIVLLPTEHDGEKNGIDDFIVRHGADAFKKLIEQFKILQSSRFNLLHINRGTGETHFSELEPISSIKGLMTWSCLKDQLAWREGYGWYKWNNQRWILSSEAQVLNLIQSFRYANQWLTISDEICLKEIKAGIAHDDIKWNPSNIIGFENGYLDTVTNKLIPHNKNAYLTVLLPFSYKTNITCPTWLKFLNSVFEGNKDKIEYVRAWFKWIISPKPQNYPIEATLWLVGQQGTGKGTFLSVLRSLVGVDNYAGIEPDQMSNPNHLFGLIDKKLSLNSDATGFIGNVGIYNRICSNEPVTVKNLYQNQFNACLNTVTVMAMNKPIGFPSGGSEGLSRRLHVLNFDKVPTYRDPELKEKLSKELEGIFCWCWQLSMAQTKQILNWRVTEAVQEIYQGQITEILFLQNKYPDGEDLIQASQLYEEYSEWIKTNGYKLTNSQNFYLALKKLNGVEKIRNCNGRYYCIPSMEEYIDPEFAYKHTSPSEISNTECNMTGTAKNDGSMTGNHDGFLLTTMQVMTGMTGFSVKNSEPKNNNNLVPLEKVSKKPDIPDTAHTQQGLNPTYTSDIPVMKNDLSCYKTFQSIAKVNSCDIREARNRSEKIKADILACTNKEELQLVREDFGYTALEIDWVWNNLLTDQQRKEITELTKREQQELNLENAVNIEEKNSDLDQQILDLSEVINYDDSIINSLSYDFFYISDWRNCNESQKKELINELDFKVQRSLAMKK
jgi:P4 family phage/plasmid primase-like protien